MADATMADDSDLILGEYQRTIDERHRVSIPQPLIDAMRLLDNQCILTKERPGALSLWDARRWNRKLDQGVDLVRAKMAGGRLNDRVDDLQRLGRLLSTRQRTVQLAGRGRLLIPEGFREFLGIEPGEEVLVIGASLCIEIWHPRRWIEYLDANMTQFRQLFDELSG